MPNSHSMTGRKDLHRKELCIHSVILSSPFNISHCMESKSASFFSTHFFYSWNIFVRLLNTFVSFDVIYMLYPLDTLLALFSHTRGCWPLVSQSLNCLFTNLMRCATFRHTSFTANFSISIYFSWGFVRVIFILASNIWWSGERNGYYEE